MNIGKTPPKLSKYSFLIIVVLSILVLAYATKNPLVQEEKKITYSEFRQMAAKKGEITEIAYINQQDKIRGKGKDGKVFTVNVPKTSDTLDKALSDLSMQGVKVDVENPGIKESFGSLFYMIIIPALLFVGLWFLIMRQAHIGGGQAMSFGRSRAKMLTDNLPQVTFDDVAGVDEAKEELEEIIEFLKDPKRFQVLGAKIPKGVLLVGPPGAGKTLLARAVAGEAKVPFFHMSGSDFVEMFVGVGASRVRDLFDQAKKNSPCLVFIDEMDAVGRQRGAGLGGGHDEREQTLNQLLVEMDGFDPNAGVILLAATNRPDVLDPALLRPGRFDRRVVVDRPDVKGRLAILEVHARGKKIDTAVDLEIVARRTPGFTGADLANIMNEAAILAARFGENLVTMLHIDEAIERNIAGPERKTKLLSEPARKVTAYHEAGHALVARLTPDSDPVHKISILPRGMALGYTLQLPVEDKYMTAKSELLNDIKVLLGGRVAEELVFGKDSITTGAASDLERVKTIARKMVCEFGMSENLGPLTFGHKHEAIFLGRDLAEERDYSEEIASKIDAEIKSIVGKCYDETEELICNNMDRLKLVADKLMENETLSGVLLENLLDGKDLPGDEIDRLKTERRQNDEQANRERRAKKETDLARKQNEAAASQSAEPGATPEPVGAAQLSDGSIAKFTGTLNDILATLYRPKMRGCPPQSPITSADELFFSKKDFKSSLQYIRLGIKECRDTDIIPGLRIMLGLAYLNLGYVELVPDELMAALMTAPDKLEQNVERTLVKSISYFRIVTEELKKNNLTLSKLLSDRAMLDRIDTRYSEWEQRTGYQAGSQSTAN